MSNLLVLVVEDDAPVRNLISTTLKTRGYEYLIAQNGESAIMEASSHNPDVVLLIWDCRISTVWMLSKKYAHGLKCRLS